MPTISDILEKYYVNHEVNPYISPDRDLGAWLLDPKPVSKRNMELLKDGLLAGDIILLWRIHFGTFTTETWFPKYFEYTYGIHAPEHVKVLVDKGYAYIESAFDSLDHINATMKKAILKKKGVAGLSKMKAADLNQALANHFTEEELAQEFSVRGYQLTEKGKQALEEHQAIIDRHPKKNL
ncbi:Uncharacterised protein [Streptococcus australis]|nr:hypothetical protein [Streptococcus australis]EGU65472.1 hypothetical protein HMPREF9961_0399 [Streptococcus australis ATCC 700641]MDB8644798.1 hypothetical protein [Streptococcus australis]SQH66861.1 Uncharacterised protein [Streptococcus australis]